MIKAVLFDMDGTLIDSESVCLKAIPHKGRLTALYAICLHIFRHIAQKTLDIRQYAGGFSAQSDEKSDYASDAQSLCGIALNVGKKQ